MEQFSKGKSFTSCPRSRCHMWTKQGVMFSWFWYNVGSVLSTACRLGPDNDTKWPWSFPKHDGLLHVTKAALSPLLQAVTDQSHFTALSPLKNLAVTVWHLPSPIVARVMKVVLILPFEVLHVVWGARRGAIGWVMWKIGREKRETNN